VQVGQRSSSPLRHRGPNLRRCGFWPTEAGHFVTLTTPQITKRERIARMRHAITVAISDLSANAASLDAATEQPA
jgi:hypothetical protein